MRGENTKQSSMLMLMSPESRVPTNHPIRRIKKLADDALAKLSPVFDEMYSSMGRPSIPPERLLKATLLMALYTIRSERQFCEQLDYNLLYRWFLDMDMTESSFDPTAFTHNRTRLIAHDVAGEFFRAVVEQARAAQLMSSEHFKGYDTREFVAECRARNVTPHVAQKQHSAIDKRTAGSIAYAISLRMRKRVEEVFGWMKTVGNFRKARYVGIGNNQLAQRWSPRRTT